MKRALGHVGVGGFMTAGSSLFGRPRSLLGYLGALGGDRPSTSRAAAEASEAMVGTNNAVAVAADEYEFAGTYKDASKYVKD